MFCPIHYQVQPCRWCQPQEHKPEPRGSNMAGWDANRYGDHPGQIDRTKTITNEQVASELQEPWRPSPFSWVDDRQVAESPSEDNTAHVKGFGNNRTDYLGTITIVEKLNLKTLVLEWWVSLGKA